MLGLRKFRVEYRFFFQRKKKANSQENNNWIHYFHAVGKWGYAKSHQSIFIEMFIWCDCILSGAQINLVQQTYIEKPSEILFCDRAQTFSALFRLFGWTICKIDYMSVCCLSFVLFVVCLFVVCRLFALKNV